MKMRTSFDENDYKELEDGDFVVFVTGLQTLKLIAGVYRQSTNSTGRIYFFKGGVLTSHSVLQSEIAMGIIVGTKDKSFPLLDKITIEIGRVHENVT